MQFMRWRVRPQRLKEMKCPTDPGFMLPKASNKAHFRKLNFAISSPETRSPLIRWYGPRAWPAGSGPGDIPGLMSGRSGPPAVPPARGQPASAAGQYGATDHYAGDRYGPGGGSLSFDAGMLEFLGQSLLYVIGMLLVVPAPWLATGFYRWAMAPPAGAGSAESRLHRSADGHLVRASAGLGLLIYVGRLGHLVQPRRHCRAGLSVMDDPALDREQSQLQRAAAADHLQRQRADLYRLAPAVGHFRHHDRRLGLGRGGADAMDLPQHRRHPSRDLVQGDGIGNAVADARVRSSPAPSSSRSPG